MKFLVCPDSYKGSLSAKEVALHMERAIKSVNPKAEVILLPIADGGEGTVEALTTANKGEILSVEVSGPTGRSVVAKFGIFPNKETAVIEVAQASGLTLLAEEERNPKMTTSYGTGELIKHALDLGCKQIIVGLGGSATNDGGVGMAQALGVRFYTKDGNEISRGGSELIKIESIDLSQLDPRIQQTEIVIASDVINPLCGEQGASYVFGPQKGATSEMVVELDGGLKNLADKIKKDLHIEIENVEGSGAAGGLGAGLMAFLGGKMRKGIDLIFEYTNIEEWMEQVDYVLTGEGHTDRQTLFGKAPVGIAKVAKKYHKPVICISGGISTEVTELYHEGIDIVVGAVQAPMSLEEAMKHAGKNIFHATSSIVRTLLISSSNSIRKGNGVS